MSASKDRIYIVRPKSGQGAGRLVKGVAVAQVARHVVKTTVDIEVAGQQALVDAIKAGVQIEIAGVDGAESGVSA